MSVCVCVQENLGQHYEFKYSIHLTESLYDLSAVSLTQYRNILLILMYIYVGTLYIYGYRFSHCEW